MCLWVWAPQQFPPAPTAGPLWVWKVLQPEVPLPGEALLGDELLSRTTMKVSKPLLTESLCICQPTSSKVTVSESHRRCCTLLFSACGPRWASLPLCISSHCSPPTRTESLPCVCSLQTPAPAAARTPSWATGSPAITQYMQMHCKCNIQVFWDLKLNIYWNKTKLFVSEHHGTLIRFWMKMAIFPQAIKNTMVLL